MIIKTNQYHHSLNLVSKLNYRGIQMTQKVRKPFGYYINRRKKFTNFFLSWIPDRVAY